MGDIIDFSKNRIEEKLKEMERSGMLNWLEGVYDKLAQEKAKERQNRPVVIYDYKIARFPIVPIYNQFIELAESRREQIKQDLNVSRYNERVTGNSDGHPNFKENLFLEDFFVNGFSQIDYESVVVYNGHFVPLILKLASPTLVHMSGNFTDPSSAILVANMFREMYLGNVEPTIIE